MTLTIYHNPRCSKSRETLALLAASGLTPRIIEYLKNPPNREELKHILQVLGFSAAQLVRKKEATDAGIDVATSTETELIAAMIRHPEIIERPIVVNGSRAALGRPPESVLSII